VKASKLARWAALPTAAIVATSAGVAVAQDHDDATPEVETTDETIAEDDGVDAPAIGDETDDDEVVEDDALTDDTVEGESDGDESDADEVEVVEVVGDVEDVESDDSDEVPNGWTAKVAGESRGEGVPAEPAQERADGEHGEKRGWEAKSHDDEEEAGEVVTPDEFEVEDTDASDDEVADDVDVDDADASDDVDDFDEDGEDGDEG
jgi:hypothetical protein